MQLGFFHYNIKPYYHNHPFRNFFEITKVYLSEAYFSNFIYYK